MKANKVNQVKHQHFQSLSSKSNKSVGRKTSQILKKAELFSKNLILSSDLYGSFKPVKMDAETPKVFNFDFRDEKKMKEILVAQKLQYYRKDSIEVGVSEMTQASHQNVSIPPSSFSITSEKPSKSLLSQAKFRQEQSDSTKFNQEISDSLSNSFSRNLTVNSILINSKVQQDYGHILQTFDYFNHRKQSSDSEQLSETKSENFQVNKASVLNRSSTLSLPNLNCESEYSGSIGPQKMFAEAAQNFNVKGLTTPSFLRKCTFTSEEQKTQNHEYDIIQNNQQNHVITFQSNFSKQSSFSEAGHQCTHDLVKSKLYEQNINYFFTQNRQQRQEKKPSKITIKSLFEERGSFQFEMNQNAHFQVIYCQVCKAFVKAEFIRQKSLTNLLCCCYQQDQDCFKCINCQNTLYHKRKNSSSNVYI